MKIQKYDIAKKSHWNNFLKNSKNGTFLFNRDYMEYHSDRFEDCSLLVYDDKGILISLLPASIHGQELRTHGGLTYGGFITDHTMKTEKMIKIFESFLDYIKINNIYKIIYKAIPHIYHCQPSEEDLYSLFRFNFNLYRRDVSSTINIRTTNVKGQKRNGFKKAQKLGLLLIETNDSKDILNIVNDNLSKKYNTTAVHTYEEMNKLKNNFKKNIIIFNLLIDNNIEGGAILYIDNNTIHAQYITTTNKAKSSRGLDFIVVSIIDMYKEEFEWFDFGISTEDDGRYLNSNLLKSKEDFNMSAVCYDFYELEID
jgi:hypothetical protein